MSSYFYLRIAFPNPHILLKTKTCVFKICHTRFFSASGSIHDNISSLSITKNLIEILRGFDFFCSFPEYEK